jgi:hypothetical protein
MLLLLQSEMHAPSQSTRLLTLSCVDRNFERASARLRVKRVEVSLTWRRFSPQAICDGEKQDCDYSNGSLFQLEIAAGRA